MKPTQNVILALTCLTLAACGDGKPAGQNLSAQQSALSSALAGTYGGECSTFTSTSPTTTTEPTTGKSTTDSSTAGTWVNGQITFASGNQVSQEIDLYSDSQCQTLVDKIEIGGSYQLGKRVKGQKGSFDIDYDAKVTKITVYDQKWADQENQASECGYTDWKVGEAKDATGDCAHGWSIAQEQFSIIKWDGTHFYMGTDEAGPLGTSAEYRHQSVSKDPLKKINNGSSKNSISPQA